MYPINACGVLPDSSTVDSRLVNQKYGYQDWDFQTKIINNKDLALVKAVDVAMETTGPISG